MKRIRIVGLCLTAMFVLAAVASASASAHEYQVEGGTPPQEITGSGGAAKLEGTILKEKITIECSTQTVNSGEILAGGLSTGEITYSGCKVVGNAACKVPNIKFKVKDELTGGPPVKDLFLPTGANEEFVSIRLEGCALQGTYPVKGQQTCNLPEGEVFKKEHTIECTPAGSKLTLGGEEAHYTGNITVSLVSELPFRAI